MHNHFSHADGLLKPVCQQMFGAMFSIGGKRLNKHAEDSQLIHTQCAHDANLLHTHRLHKEYIKTWKPSFSVAFNMYIQTRWKCESSDSIALALVGLLTQAHRAEQHRQINFLDKPYWQSKEESLLQPHISCREGEQSLHTSADRLQSAAQTFSLSDHFRWTYKNRIATVNQSVMCWVIFSDDVAVSKSELHQCSAEVWK